ncbi:uncharacterized protein F4812DRAFT_145259 [Daldinia caldariorum]|uniref:uncharacterized protein n=1 Tax=Daldinia caldariorum TaxID=326644 RepID=UPI0020078CDB|nr:uncharacterized protein F4812DRAFT_145259 [Daldinia caldariorum]KAI1464938.1 hypothetical protein F4812DRAFT_145259 [Daldinia caldariorum]
MLSNPVHDGGLHARHRQHRRQNSTPTGYEMMKIATTNLPNMNQQQQQQQNHQRARMAHRRGMSLDTRRQQLIQQRMQPISTIPTRQEYTTVSNSTNNNTGSITSQHVLREAQKHSIARPGPQQAYANLASDDSYLISPHGTPRTQEFEGQGFGSLSNQQDMQQDMQIHLDMYNGRFSGNVTASQEFDQFPSALSTPTLMSFQDSPTGGPGWISEEETSSTRRNSRRISNGIMDRVSKFEKLGIDVQRPLTPPRQDATDYFPLTPKDTPHDRTIKHGQPPQRFSEGYDESMEETVKPTRHSSNGRSRTTFDEMRQAAESQVPMPMPNRSNTLPLMETFHQPSDPMVEFLDIDQVVNSGIRVEAFDGLPMPSHPMNINSNTPIRPQLGELNRSFDYKPAMQHPNLRTDSLASEDGFSIESSSRRGTPHHRRNESMASIASAASIASIDIEKTKTSTGITIEDINQYISGPDPRDNKWTCKFEDCNKKFGRKENIKSHVQTHLNDRQYKCPTCHKCFVRQHDLKRHAKIHTGIKPYPCECGNSFARHDALTRHKQRGMCIGAFEGVTRKVVKRGRPRKHRPDMEERKSKSYRTIKKNMSVSSVSSQSGCSDTSAGNSPEYVDQDFDVLDGIMDVSMGGTTMNPSSLQGSMNSSSAPMPSLGNNNNSDDAGPASEHSPSSAASVHSYVSQLSQISLHHQHQHQQDVLPEAALSSRPGSPAKSVTSQFAELPELSRSSSPPPSAASRYFDAEPDVPAASSISSSISSTSSIPSFAGISDDDDDVLLQFTNGETGSMLMLSSGSKFDEAFDSVDMFTNSDDLFFGSS